MTDDSDIQKHMGRLRLRIQTRIFYCVGSFFLAAVLLWIPFTNFGLDEEGIRDTLIDLRQHTEVDAHYDTVVLIAFVAIKLTFFVLGIVFAICGIKMALPNPTDVLVLHLMNSQQQRETHDPKKE